MGQTRRPIELYEQALDIAREIGDRSSEGIFLCNLANCYVDLGQTQRAIELYEQALAIVREIGARSSEGYCLHNLSGAFTDKGQHSRAVEYASAAVTVGAELPEPRLGSYSGGSLARAHLVAGELAKARSAVEAARLCDAPENNFYVCALGGAIALRQGDRPAAEQMLAAAMTEASRMLKANSDNYQALDSKPLALCGLVLCGATGRLADVIGATRTPNFHRRDAREAVLAGVLDRELALKGAADAATMKTH